MKKRCPWSDVNDRMRAYHDSEWGVPVHDDRELFEHMVLDAFQAGLSWSTILDKRENFRKAFDGFVPEKIARYGKAKVERLMNDPGIVRNRMKIEATVNNAKACLALKKDFGTLDAFLWQFVGGRTRTNKFRTLKQIPAQTKESQAMSKALKARGFSFVGPTICYAFMQAAGLVNDHLVGCFRHRAVSRKKK